MKISTNHNYGTNFVVTNDQVAKALNKFRNDPSIAVIKKDQSFSFGPVTCNNIFKKTTNNLDNAKASRYSK